MPIDFIHPLQTIWMRDEMILSVIKQVWIQFSFSKFGYHSKVKELSHPDYYTHSCRENNWTLTHTRTHIDRFLKTPKMSVDDCIFHLRLGKSDFLYLVWYWIKPTKGKLRENILEITSSGYLENFGVFLQHVFCDKQVTTTKLIVIDAASYSHYISQRI